MKPLILLDIDGVLNPAVRPGGPGSDGPALVLSRERAMLVNRLAACGQIAWVTTWPAEQTAGLEAQLQMRTGPLRVPLPARALHESDEQTPKLRPITRWLARMEAEGDADWDAVVWIDDVLGPDALCWAGGNASPVMLLRPAPDTGLTAGQVAEVEGFAARWG
jgi:hypothetical protein